MLLEGARTSTVKLQIAGVVALVAPGIVAPVRLKELEPATAVGVPVQPVVLAPFVSPVTAGVGATISALLPPVGSGSDRLKPVSGVPTMLFVIVIVTLEMPPTGTVVGLKDLAIVSAVVLLSVAVAGARLEMFSLFVTPPARIVLVEVVVLPPGARTFTAKVQVEPAVIVAPAKEMLGPPTVAVGVPVQPVPVRPVMAGVGAICNVLVAPAGRVSVSPRFVSDAAVLFVTLIVNLETPPTAIVVGLKDFATVTPLVFVSVAAAGPDAATD